MDTLTWTAKMITTIVIANGPTKTKIVKTGEFSMRLPSFDNKFNTSILLFFLPAMLSFMSFKITKPNHTFMWKFVVCVFVVYFSINQSTASNSHLHPISVYQVHHRVMHQTITKYAEAYQKPKNNGFCETYCVVVFIEVSYKIIDKQWLSYFENFLGKKPVNT